MTNLPPNTPERPDTWSREPTVRPDGGPAAGPAGAGAGAGASRADAETQVMHFGPGFAGPAAGQTASAARDGGALTPEPLLPPFEPVAEPSMVEPDIEAPPQRMALVVVIGMVLLAAAFTVMILVNVSSASINALAVIATPIAAMVAAYYGITLSIQQVRNERIEKQRALARADAAEAASRDNEVWAAQLESGLRVAMAKLNAAGVSTDEVTKAAGTPDGFF